MSTQANVATNAIEKPPTEPVPEGQALTGPENLNEGESAGTAEQSTIDKPMSAKDLGKFFEAVESRDGSGPATEAVIKAAGDIVESAGKKEGGQLVHSKNMVGGAIGRIGSPVSTGLDANQGFADAQLSLDILMSETRERLNALKVESANAEAT